MFVRRKEVMIQAWFSRLFAAQFQVLLALLKLRATSPARVPIIDDLEMVCNLHLGLSRTLHHSYLFPIWHAAAARLSQCVASTP